MKNKNKSKFENFTIMKNRKMTEKGNNNSNSKNKNIREEIKNKSITNNINMNGKMKNTNIKKNKLTTGRIMKNKPKSKIKKKKRGRPFEVKLSLEECNRCGRSFATDRIDKHQRVCLGNQKPKKVRRFHKIMTKKQKNKDKKLKQNNWRLKHEEFIKQMKYMKTLKKAEDQGIDIKTIAPPPCSINPDFLECKHCGRTFNPKAHFRHEKACANIINKPKALKRKLFNKYKKKYK